MLSNSQIIEFQELFYTKFGRRISMEEAVEKGGKLVELMKMVYKPLTLKDYKKMQSQMQD